MNLLLAKKDVLTIKGGWPAGNNQLENKPRAVGWLVRCQGPFHLLASSHTPCLAPSQPAQCNKARRAGKKLPRRGLDGGSRRCQFSAQSTSQSWPFTRYANNISQDSKFFALRSLSSSFKFDYCPGLFLWNMFNLGLYCSTCCVF